jgi:Tripartite tricarboxylate transporter family receptor
MRPTTLPRILRPLPPSADPTSPSWRPTRASRRCSIVAAAKAKPGSITFGTAGVGSATHISAEILRFSAGFEALQIPFPEIMAGRVDFTCSTIATALPFIREGKLVALAVSTPQRSSALPDVPTTIEAGYKNSDYTFWTGLFVPAKTPREIVGKLSQETQAGRAGETRAARHGPDADHARCLRCADQAGDRFNSRLGQSGEPKVQLTGIGRVAMDRMRHLRQRSHWFASGLSEDRKGSVSAKFQKFGNWSFGSRGTILACSRLSL